jgi:hypothetical protein
MAKEEKFIHFVGNCAAKQQQTKKTFINNYYLFDIIYFLES